MDSSTIKALQEHMLDIMRAQQQAYLAAIKSWQQPSLSAVLLEAAGAIPEGLMTPTSAEIIEATHAFSTRMVEDQRKFLADLKEVTGNDRRTGPTVLDHPSRRDADQHFALCNRAEHARDHHH